MDQDGFTGWRGPGRKHAGMTDRVGLNHSHIFKRKESIRGSIPLRQGMVKLKLPDMCVPVPKFCVYRCRSTEIL